MTEFPIRTTCPLHGADSDGARTIWGVTSYDRGGNAGYVVHALFTTREQALVYAEAGDKGDEYTDAECYSIEEFDLYEIAPKPYTYWHRGAHVYPDGEIKDWCVEHRAQPPGHMPDVDDHLAPWNGHTQGHCGLHVSIFGTDREAVEAAFKNQLSGALAQSNGKCPGCERTAPPYKRDFWDGLGG